MQNERLDNYIINHCSEEDKLLTELSRETHLKALMPRMLSGHLQGKVLELLSKMLQPEKILELGTYTGYSAICLAKGLAENGKLHTIEINDELQFISSKYFEKAGCANKIIQHIGDATQIATQLGTNFDLIFIDADKRQYPQYYKIAMQILKPGGIIIADNVLWGGKVIEPVLEKDTYTKGILEFNKMVQEDSNSENFIFPLRDGLMMVRKL